MYRQNPGLGENSSPKAYKLMTVFLLQTVVAFFFFLTFLDCVLGDGSSQQPNL